MNAPKTSTPSERKTLTKISAQAAWITIGYCLAGFSLILALSGFQLIDRMAFKYVVLAHCIMTGVVFGISLKVFR